MFSVLIIGKGSKEQKDKMLKEAKTLSVQLSDGLRYQVRLQIGGQYFVSSNIEVEDGLFNGSTGTLQRIVYGRNRHTGEPAPESVWMDFKSPLIGANARSKSREAHLYPDWVPIGRMKRPLQHFFTPGTQLIREQIPVVAANAITIDKAQGSTIPTVVVSLRRFRRADGSLSRRLTREQLYVACSRASSLEGLFLDGIFVPPAPPGPSDPVTLEMERLRNIPYEPSIMTFQKYNGDFYKIYFHNIQSFQAHFEDLRADHCAQSR